MPDPIRIEIWPDKDVTITVPHLDRDDVIGILATFLGREQPEAHEKLKSLLQQGRAITLILTSRRHPAATEPGGTPAI